MRIRTAFALLLLLPAAAFAQELDKAVSAMVRISGTRNGTPVRGTGFVVGLDRDKATIVTAAHVIEGVQQIEVAFAADFADRFPADGFLRMESSDRTGLAVVQVRGALPAGVTPLSFEVDSRPRLGEPLFLLGFPQMALEPRTTQRVLSGRSGTLLLIDQEAGEGFSGGPVLQGGKVVGVVTEADGQTTYAVNAVVVRESLEGWGVKLGGKIEPELGQQQVALEKEKNIWADVESKVRPAVVHVECRYHLRYPLATNTESSALMVEGPKGHVTGSGTQIRPGLILTALHVVEPWRFTFSDWDELTRRQVKSEYDVLEVQFPGRQPLKASVVTVSKTQDLALLQVQQTSTATVPLGSNADVKVTDEIAILSYAGGPGDSLSVFGYEISILGSKIRNPTFIRGTVAQRLTDTGMTPYYFFDASIGPGSGGAPVVDRSGTLIGIVSFQLQPQMPAGNAAVAPDEIMDFLRKSGII